MLESAMLICPNCQSANPIVARFCMYCATALLQTCTYCQALMPLGVRLCSNCGQPVAGSSPLDAARLNRLAAAAPPPLVAKVHAENHLAGERRLVTALFVDVVPDPGQGDRLAAADWATLVNQALDRFHPAIYRYEGTITRLMGDALLAFFGAPVAHEDDAIRAVHAALDLLTAARAIASEAQQLYGSSCAVQICLSTGLVVVGPVGSNLTYDYTDTGDVVNLTALMQASAPPMTVLISEYTYRFIAPIFDCVPLGSIPLKGKREPVQTYAVRGPKAEPGSVRGLAGLVSPMVGRGDELKALLRLTAAVQARLGRVALIIGDAGLGKSRLIAEWKAATTSTGVVRTLPVQWAEGHSLSYGRELAYHLLVDLLRSLLGVPMASEPETRNALYALSNDLFGEAALEFYPYLGHLLSLQLEGQAQERLRALDSRTLQTQYLVALRELLRAMAARQPLVLVLEDIHWADPSSTELLLRLLPLAAEAPLLFCITARPDQDTPGWRLVTAARELIGNSLTELTLRALSEADSSQLVANLLEIDALPSAVRDLILKKAEGNPFFVEEVIRMLIDRGAIERQSERWVMAANIDSIEIPDNLQGLLLARIDRLPDDIRLTLRIASVIGRHFSLKVLERVLQKENEL